MSHEDKPRQTPDEPMSPEASAGPIRRKDLEQRDVLGSEGVRTDTETNRAMKTDQTDDKEPTELSDRQS